MAVVLGLDADVVEQTVKAVNLPERPMGREFQLSRASRSFPVPLRGIEAGSAAVKAKGS